MSVKIGKIGKGGERERERERELKHRERRVQVNVKGLTGKGRHSNIPLKSGNTSGSGLSLIFCSFLLRNRSRITEVSRNHLLLRIKLKSRKASSIRLYRRNNH